MPKVQTTPPDQLHARAEALLAALNELFRVEWTMTPGSRFYAYVLTLPDPEGGKRPFIFSRAIEAKHINAEPFRTALQFTDEVCERWGRFNLLKPDEAQF